MYVQHFSFLYTNSKTWTHLLPVGIEVFVAYTPPNTFADGNPLLASEVEANNEALRVYLHRGVIDGDLEASKWIETRHIQPPIREPYTGLQHGVTGFQGGQWAGGESIRLTFATKALSGNGRSAATNFHHFSNTAFTLGVRRDAKILYHYWWECENGRDVSTAAYQVPEAERRMYVTPWIGNIENAYTGNRNMSQETRNMATIFSTSPPYGQTATYPQGGGYGARQGTKFHEFNSVGYVRIGLAIHSLADRGGIVNWGVAIEAYYL